MNSIGVVILEYKVEECEGREICSLAWVNSRINSTNASEAT